MTLHVAIDFGTSSTCAVVSMDDEDPKVIVFDGRPLIPSAVYGASDRTLFVGHEAERHAAVDPSRFEPHPKRRVDEGELLLGTTVLGVSEVIRAVLARVVEEARRYASGAVVDMLVLAHPAEWGEVRCQVLRSAAEGLARELELVQEPVAAAVFHSAGRAMQRGEALAVLDFGGGSVDTSVVRPAGRGFEVLAVRGDPTFGGADIDQALLEHVGSSTQQTDPEAWRRLIEGREMADRRRARVIRQDVRGAKETLSRHAYTDIPMPPPFTDAHVTREDLEQLIKKPLSKAADMVLATLADARISRDQLSGVFLVGGSSRIPMISRLVHERTGVMPTTLDQPETVVARGALRAARAQRTHEVDISQQSTDVHVLANATAPTVRSTPPQASAPVRPRKGRGVWLVGSAAALVMIVGVTLGMTVPPAARPLFEEVASQQAQQRGYEFQYPASWGESGRDPTRNQTRIEPLSEGPGTAVIDVRRQQGSYLRPDDRQRLVKDLRADISRSGADISGFEPQATFGGREVVYYQQKRGTDSVDWFVLPVGQSAVRIGCQYTETTREHVRQACQEVVSTLSADA